MKSKLLTITALLAGMLFSINAQDFSNLGMIQLKDPADYKNNEKTALDCANYLLNSRFDDLDKDLTHNQAQLFLIKWMGGTPDYMFSLDETVTKATGSNTSLLSIFLAASVKYVLENKEMSTNEEEVKFNSFLIFLKYCEDPAKDSKLNGEIKKMIKAKNENSLREYLNI